MSEDSGLTIRKLERAIAREYPTMSVRQRNWMLCRLLSYENYSGFAQNQVGGQLYFTMTRVERGLPPLPDGRNPLVHVDIDTFVTGKLGIKESDWEALQKNISNQHTGKEEFENTVLKNDFAHLMYTSSANYALMLGKVGGVAPMGFSGGKKEAVQYAGFMGDAVLVGKYKKEVSFDERDYCADTDAENLVARSVTSKQSFTETMNTYYEDVSRDSTVREKEFVSRYGGFDGLVSKVHWNLITPDNAAYLWHKSVQTPADLPAVGRGVDRSSTEGMLKEIESLPATSETGERLRFMQEQLEVEGK